VTTLSALYTARWKTDATGWRPEDVSAEDRGYDLLSHGPDETAPGGVRYIEVKGRAGQGAVELSENEWLKAEQLGGDYWRYIAYLRYR
jgi:hypothetical protein